MNEINDAKVDDRVEQRTPTSQFPPQRLVEPSAASALLHREAGVLKPISHEHVVVGGVAAPPRAVRDVLAFVGRDVENVVQPRAELDGHVRCADSRAIDIAGSNHVAALGDEGSHWVLQNVRHQLDHRRRSKRGGAAVIRRRCHDVGAVTRAANQPFDAALSESASNVEPPQ